MRRSMAVLAGLTLTLVLGPAPAAHPVGAGVCSITGTITFTAAAVTPDRGEWRIAPAVIQCRGQFNTKELMLRDGPFEGSGSYSMLPDGANGCLRELGTGTVDYWIHTEKQDVHVNEEYAFTLAGAGAFMTPTLRGAFQAVMYEGNCLTAPVTKATFLAQVTMFRESSADYTP